MSQQGHFVAAADVVEEKTLPPLPPPLTRSYEGPDQLACPVAPAEIEACAERDTEIKLSSPEAAASAAESNDSEHDDHLRNIMNSFQLAVTPPAVKRATLAAPVVSELLPSFDGPQLKFPIESGS